MALLYYDLLRHASDYLLGFQATILARQLPGVVKSALDAIAVSLPWPELTDLLRIGQTAPQTTGTIAIASDGITVTLTGATWPTWAPGAVLVAADRASLVQHRNSTTVILLHPDFGHTVTLAAGATYSLYRPAYALPADVRRIQYPHRDGSQLHVVSFPQWLTFLTTNQTSSGASTHVAVGRDPIRSTGGDGVAAWFWPLPSAADEVEIGIERWIGHPTVAYTGGTDLTKFEALSGRATVTTGTPDVTFASANSNLPTQVARGARLRLSTGTTEPTPLSEEFTVLTRVSATALTTVENASQTYTTVAYVLSDPIGLEEHVWGEVLRRAIEWQIDIVSPARRKAIESSERLYFSALDRAREKSSALGNVGVAGGRLGGAIRQARPIAGAGDYSGGWYY